MFQCSVPDPDGQSKGLLNRLAQTMHLGQAFHLAETIYLGKDGPFWARCRPQLLAA